MGAPRCPASALRMDVGSGTDWTGALRFLAFVLGCGGVLSSRPAAARARRSVSSLVNSSDIPDSYHKP